MAFLSTVGWAIVILSIIGFLLGAFEIAAIGSLFGIYGLALSPLMGIGLVPGLIGGVYLGYLGIKVNDLDVARDDSIGARLRAAEAKLRRLEAKGIIPEDEQPLPRSTLTATGDSCPVCGANLHQATDWCPNCGARLGSP